MSAYHKNSKQKKQTLPGLQACSLCETSEKIKQTLRLIPTNRPDRHFFPKYIPQLRENCPSCGKFKGYAFQDAASVTRWNEKLKDVPLVVERGVK